MIRDLALADLPQVVAIEQAVFGAAAWSAAGWQEEAAAQGPDRRYLVALDGQDGGGVVGYAGILRAGSDADVLTIAVAADRQGRGLGRGLMSALLEVASAWRSRSVFLEVEPENSPAVALYRGLGFRAVGERRHYYGPGRHARTMQLQLREPIGSQLLGTEAP
jgi:ribosomal-protein-alanine N-acetyltransferase